MSPFLSERSLALLRTVDARLHAVAESAARETSFTVTCGHRGSAQQEAARLAGRSRHRFPESPHNSYPARAFDARALLTGMRQEDLAAVLMEHAAKLGVGLWWDGGDHFELRDAAASG